MTARRVPDHGDAGQIKAAAPFGLNDASQNVNSGRHIQERLRPTAIAAGASELDVPGSDALIPQVVGKGSAQ
jgi:hypothetical protein